MQVCCSCCASCGCIPPVGISRPGVGRSGGVRGFQPSACGNATAQALQYLSFFLAAVGELGRVLALCCVGLSSVANCCTDVEESPHAAMRLRLHNSNHDEEDEDESPASSPRAKRGGSSPHGADMGLGGDQATAARRRGRFTLGRHPRSHAREHIDVAASSPHVHEGQAMNEHEHGFDGKGHGATDGCGAMSPFERARLSSDTGSAMKQRPVRILGTGAIVGGSPAAGYSHG